MCFDDLFNDFLEARVRDERLTGEGSGPCCTDTTAAAWMHATVYSLKRAVGVPPISLVILATHSSRAGATVSSSASRGAWYSAPPQFTAYRCPDGPTKPAATAFSPLCHSPVEMAKPRRKASSSPIINPLSILGQSSPDAIRRLSSRLSRSASPSAARYARPTAG